MALSAVRKNLLLLGTCVPCMRHNASKIRVISLDLDTNLLKYFKKEEFYFAHDPKKICKSGDVVLIEALSDKQSPNITHKVLEVVYPLGDITDPISGKKVVVGAYRDEVAEKMQHYGDKLSSAFDYDKTPQRGWQRGKRDFTHRESYIKYNDFQNLDQPYAL